MQTNSFCLYSLIRVIISDIKKTKIANKSFLMK